MPAISQPSVNPPSQASLAMVPDAAASAAAQRLEEGQRRTNQLLATVAHELRNPLDSLRNAIEILSQAKVDAALSAKAAGIARRQIEQMSRLIAELIDAGHLASSGRLTLNLSCVRLQDVVANAIETSAAAVSRGGHTLRLKLPQEPVWIRADATRCAQIFCNLLANAAKYTPPHGLITVTAGQEHAVARVCVTDNGVGIAPEALEGVFEVFRQEQRSLPLSQGGLGIGLSVVKRLVQLHGGTVHAESGGEHQGSTFVVELPLFPDKEQSGRASSH